MSRRGQTSRGGSQGDIPWLSFRQITSKSSQARARNKLEALKQKEIYLPNAIDWDWLGKVGPEEELTPYLVKERNMGDSTIICDGWL